MQAEIKNNYDKKCDDISTKLEKYIVSLVKEEGYITYDVEKRNVSSKGGSYMGLLYEVDIKGKTLKEDGDKETNIFMKHIIITQKPLTLNISDIYKRENFVYADLKKEMYDLQEKNNLPIEERYKIAKAFKACNDETIILENLAAKGFKTYYRMDVINLEYAELAIKDLARLHGLSIAIEKQRPDYFEKNIKNMNFLYIFNKNWEGHAHNMCLFASQFLENDKRKKVHILRNVVNKYPSYRNDTSNIKTICHGDFRHNNIMVKEINGKPTEVIAVDYQITHRGNPVLDFIYFIFWGTDQEFRRNHLEHLKELYHQHLGKYLEYFDIQVENVFPKKEFERQYQEKLDFGLMISVLQLPYLFPPEDDVPILTDTDTPLKKFALNVDDKYGERFRGIFNDFVEWGYL